MSERFHLSGSRALGIVLIVVAILIVAEAWYFQAKRSNELDCQSDYNQAVAEDRAALNDMIFTLVNPKSDETKRRAAVTTYVQRARQTDLSAPDCG